jgi:hypothetical protein
MDYLMRLRAGYILSRRVKTSHINFCCRSELITHNRRTKSCHNLTQSVSYESLSQGLTGGFCRLIGLALTMPPRVGADEKLKLEMGVFWRTPAYGLSPSRIWSSRCLKRRRTTKLARMANKQARVCPVTQHGKNLVSA